MEFPFKIEKVSDLEFRFVADNEKLFKACIRALYLVCLKYYENSEK